MDAGFPRAVDEKFSGMTGRVTAALQFRGKPQSSGCFAVQL